MIEVVYIVGYGRSRSTYLERLLISMAGDATVSAGELANIGEKLTEDGACQCGRPLRACRVWGDVAAANGIPGHNDGLFHSWRLSPSDRSSFVAMQSTLVRCGYTRLIDSSKTSVRHALRPARWRASGASVRCVLPIRRLDGVILSRIARAEREGRRLGRAARAYVAFETLLSWHLANVVALCYRPLIVDTDRLLRRPEETTRVAGVILGTFTGTAGAEHMVAGNRMRFLPLESRVERSERLSTIESVIAACGRPFFGLMKLKDVVAT